MLVKNGQFILKQHNDMMIDLVEVKISSQNTIDLMPNLQFKTVTDQKDYLISLHDNVMEGFTYKIATDEEIYAFYINEIVNNHNINFLPLAKLKEIVNIINSG